MLFLKKMSLIDSFSYPRTRQGRISEGLNLRKLLDKEIAIHLLVMKFYQIYRFLKFVMYGNDESVFFIFPNESH